MKSPSKSEFWVAIVGAIMIWYGLVQIGTHKDPLGLETYDAKWSAILVVAGVFFLAIAVSFSVKHFDEDDDDSK